MEIVESYTLNLKTKQSSCLIRHKLSFQSYGQNHTHERGPKERQKKTYNLGKNISAFMPSVSKMHQFDPSSHADQLSSFKFTSKTEENQVVSFTKTHLAT